MNPGVIAAIAAVAVFAASLGITSPLLAILLERAGMSETFIGVNTAMTPVGILISAPLIPWAAARVNVVALAMGGGAATALLIACFHLIDDPWLWFPLRFVLGVAMNVLWLLSETWINQLAPASGRGRVMGIYATAVAGGFALGPVAVALAGTHGGLPFAIAVAGTLATLPVFYAARRHLPAFPGGTARGLWSFAHGAPVLLAACAAIALFDQTTLSLVPIYALQAGYGEEAAAVAVGVLVAGNVVLQIPIGYLADLLPRRAVLAALTALTVACAALLPSVAGGELMWPLLFVWGAAGYGAYTVALAELGARFTGAMLLAGNAAFAVMWGVGGIVGPAAAGGAMDALGPDGLPLTLGLVFAAVTVAVALRPLVAGQDGAAGPRSSASVRR